LVLSLGIALLLFWHGGGRLPMEALYGPGHHFFCAALRQDATAGFGSFLTGFAAGFFTSFLPFFGASTMTSCRPSIFGYCSTMACGSRSCFTRSIRRTPNSWCAISRPR